MKKAVQIEYLFLDLQTCDRCVGTDKVLEEVIAVISPALDLAGYSVEYRKIETSTAKLAEEYHFLSSPTILVNGQDICASVKENACGCCGQISGTDVDCRVFEYEGKAYEVPPKEMLADAILREVFSPRGTTKAPVYILPDNLKTFFAGKAKKQGCCCGTDCGCC